MGSFFFDWNRWLPPWFSWAVIFGAQNYAAMRYCGVYDVWTMATTPIKQQYRRCGTGERRENEEKKKKVVEEVCGNPHNKQRQWNDTKTPKKIHRAKKEERQRDPNAVILFSYEINLVVCSSPYTPSKPNHSRKPNKIILFHMFFCFIFMCFYHSFLVSALSLWVGCLISATVQYYLAIERMGKKNMRK